MANNATTLEIDDFTNVAHRIGRVLQDPAVQTAARVLKEEFDRPSCSLLDVTRASRAVAILINEVFAAYQGPAPISSMVVQS